MCVCGGTPTPSVYSPLCVRKGLWHVPGWSWWDCGVSGGRGGGHCAMSWAVLGSLVCPPGRWAAVCPLVMLGWWPWCVPWDGGTGSVACPQGAEGIAVACALGCGEGCGLSGAGGAQGIAGGLLGLCRSVGCWGCGSMRGAGVLLWARCECPRGAAGWGWLGRQFLKDVVVDVLLL